jgi:carbon-monoxide dehydrogenase medium subunit/xanthine dehydrogenase FAD-binding subunit
MLSCDSYVSPGSLDDALAAVAASDGRFRFVAGATDLLPWAREGRAGDVHVPLMVDLSGIPELQIVERRGDRIWIGAATPFQRFLDRADLVRLLPGMPDCAVWFADNQIRESATIGGNIVNASPAGDGIPPLLTVNATVELAALRDGHVRRRQMSLAEFIKGPGRTEAEHDEILLGVECDTLEGYGGAFEKVGHRRSLVISVVCLSALVRLDPTGRTLVDVRVAIGGVGPMARRMTDIESRLIGQPIGAELLREILIGSEQFVQSRTRQEYRKLVTPGFVARALANAIERAGGHPDVCGMAKEIAHG